jgi:hypothetical protein
MSTIPKKYVKKVKDETENVQFAKLWYASVQNFGVGSFSVRLKWIAREMGISVVKARGLYQRFLYRAKGIGVNKPIGTYEWKGKNKKW